MSSIKSTYKSPTNCKWTNCSLVVLHTTEGTKNYSPQRIGNPDFRNASRWNSQKYGCRSSSDTNRWVRKITLCKTSRERILTQYLVLRGRYRENIPTGEGGWVQCCFRIVNVCAGLIDNMLKQMKKLHKKLIVTGRT